MLEYWKIIGIIVKWAIIILFITMASSFANGNDGIYLISIGKVDKVVLEYLESGLKDVFGKEVNIAQPMDIPKSAYNPARNQYHSTLILQAMRGCSKGTQGRILGIVDVDIYVPSLNFVFGEADVNNRIALISLTRLRQDYYGLPEDNKLFYLRALKEAIHELGHTYGLGHCQNPKCVMYFSNSLLDTDRKDYHFCPKCQKNFPSHKHV